MYDLDDDLTFEQLVKALDNGFPDINTHGKVVGGRFEAFHDVITYEDGHEDWYYVGD